MAIGFLSKSFSYVGGDTTRCGSQLPSQFDVPNKLDAVGDGRNCIRRDDGLLINEQFLDAARHGAVD
jgi:hypothetical protein